MKEYTVIVDGDFGCVLKEKQGGGLYKAEDVAALQRERDELKEKLRIRDHLAQRGVFLLIAYCDDNNKTKAIAWTGDEDNFIAVHDDINVCAVLAVDALEGK